MSSASASTSEVTVAEANNVASSRGPAEEGEEIKASPADPVVAAAAATATAATAAAVAHSNYAPSHMERHLEFIDFNAEGHLILGCSNLTGRYWVGSLWYYNQPSEAPSVQGALTGVDFDAGMVDGFFIGPDGKHMLIALDSGSVEHVTLSFSEEEEDMGPSFYCLERIACAQEHDDIISGLTRTPDRVITCSFDKSIVVMDINTLCLVTRFDNAHSDLISDVSANSLDPNLIATAASDGTVATWDIRKKTPNSVIYECLADWPTAVEWSPQDDNIIVIGNQSGELGIYDTRNSKSPINIDRSIDKQIHKIKFSPYAPDTFAVSADTFPVRIFEIPKLGFRIVYEDEHHEDFVRGLAWHPESKRLWTCGWDHQVFSHEITYI